MDTVTVNTTVTIVGFIATIASLILALGAIWLSFVFYRMSNEASKETTTAAKDIQASVERLENIFDKLYSDTFSMMRDTVTDMRQHIWRKPENNGLIKISDNDEKVAELKDSISNEIMETVESKLKGLGDNNDKIKELEDSIKGILESKLDDSLKSNIAMPRSALRRRLLTMIRRNRIIKLEKLLTMMSSTYMELFDMRHERMMTELFKMREEKIITWNGPPETLSLNNSIEYLGEKITNQIHNPNI